MCLKFKRYILNKNLNNQSYHISEISEIPTTKNIILVRIPTANGFYYRNSPLTILSSFFRKHNESSNF